MSKEYTPALGFDWLSIWYDLAIKLTMPEGKFRSLLIDHLKPSAGEYILEFGFGTGANLLLAAKRSPQSQFKGLDIDPKILKIANKKLIRHKLDIPLKLYEGCLFPFESNSFDKVYSCLVFHHLDKKAKLKSLREIYRVLKPGGKIIIGDWGKAKSKMMRKAFYLVQILDGFKTTNDNVDGLLPKYMKIAAFNAVSEIGFINTKLGSFCYYEGLKN